MVSFSLLILASVASLAFAAPEALADTFPATLERREVEARRVSNKGSPVPPKYCTDANHVPVACPTSTATFPASTVASKGHKKHYTCGKYAHLVKGKGHRCACDTGYHPESLGGKIICVA